MSPDVECTAPLVEPLDNVVDDRGTGLYPRERSDSNSTIVYDPSAPIDEIPGSVVRTNRDRQDSDEDLDANPGKRSHIADTVQSDSDDTIATTYLTLLTTQTTLTLPTIQTYWNMRVST